MALQHSRPRALNAGSQSACQCGIADGPHAVHHTDRHFHADHPGGPPTESAAGDGSESDSEPEAASGQRAAAGRGSTMASDGGYLSLSEHPLAHIRACARTQAGYKTPLAPFSAPLLAAHISCEQSKSPYTTIFPLTPDFALGYAKRNLVAARCVAYKRNAPGYLGGAFFERLLRLFPPFR